MSRRKGWRKGLKVTGILIGIALLLAVAAVGLYFFVMSNVEKPAYSLVEQQGSFEIRDYPALVVAEVTRQGERYDALRAGFRPLASYIFAKEREGEKIAMTAPVTQDVSAEGGEKTWTVRFIMPSGYGLEDLPAPAGQDVRLTGLPAQRRAAVRFSGVASDALIAEQEARLRDWLAAKGLSPEGSPTYAYYNDPWTPGPLRRNEVLFDLPKP